MEKWKEITKIANLIEAFAEKCSTHPRKVSRIHAASMLVDAELIRRMEKINEATPKEFP